MKIEYCLTLGQGARTVCQNTILFTITVLFNKRSLLRVFLASKGSLLSKFKVIKFKILLDHILRLHYLSCGICLPSEKGSTLTGNNLNTEKQTGRHESCLPCAKINQIHKYIPLKMCVPSEDSFVHPRSLPSFVTQRMLGTFVLCSSVRLVHSCLPILCYAL